VGAGVGFCGGDNGGLWWMVVDSNPNLDLKPNLNLDLQ